MDTKSKKNRKIIIIIISFLIITALSASIVSRYPAMKERMGEISESYIYENSQVLEGLSKNTYILLKRAAERRMEKEMTVKEVFFPNAEVSNTGTWKEVEASFNRWEVNESLVNVHDYVFDHVTQTSDSNTKNNLQLLLGPENTDKEELLKIYGFYAIVSYDHNGYMKVNEVYGASKEIITKELESNTLINLLTQEQEWYSGTEVNLPYIEVAPSDITVVYAITKEILDWDIISSVYYRAGYQAFVNSGIVAIMLAMVAVVAVLALLMGGRKIWYKENGILAKMPLEVNIVTLMMIITVVWDGGFAISQIINNQNSENVLRFMNYEWMENVSNAIVFGCNTITWMIVLGMVFLILTSMKQIFTMGPIRYLKERTIICFVCSKTKKFFISLKEVDLTEKSNKIIFKVLAINFVIMAVLCSMWIFGIVLLMPYSILLFFLLRKYFMDLKEKYASLLRVTGKMAEGNLNVTITEDMGVFEPLKSELEEIQLGFRKAVEEEVKSQKMKTELITNVSHDLKTPLTAIITYVDLLKGEQITEEERKSYIDTLDRKSQRLKTLIEDLFEVSKANSKNVKLNIVDVDIIELMKQTQFELKDRIEEQALELKWNLPEKEEKVVLPLDSQKTFRIFENLMNNIVKYSLTGSRVYIDVLKQNQEVMISLKNISREELNIGAEEITERFVRGDRSRNTEGSGLGLSIARSFVELQGGTFQIIIDGDLFKVVIIFKLNHK